MPCTKCENGKYKWGKTGECKYDSKEACEKANKKNYNKMRPTPLGKTYEQYEKELKEYNLSKVEKVDLSLVSDFEKKTDSALTQSGKMEGIVQKIEGEQAKLKAEFVKYEKLVSAADNEYTSILRAAKDLGVDAPKEVTNLYKIMIAELKNAYKTYNEYKGK